MASSDADDPVNALPIDELIKYVQERDGMSRPNLVKRAGKRGMFDLTTNLLSFYVNGETKEYPKPDTMETLAAALDCTYDQVVNAFTRKMKRPHIWRPEVGGATVLTDHEITPEQAADYARRVERAARKK